MNETALFLSGIAVTLTVSLAVVVYLSRPLYTILVDLCATAERARFWTAFSNTTLCLVPLIFAMHYRPSKDTFLVFELGTQVKWALVGLVASVVLLGIVISRFIPRGTAAVGRSA